MDWRGDLGLGTLNSGSSDSLDAGDAIKWCFRFEFVNVAVSREEYGELPELTDRKCGR